jgi:hypothetical protein
MARWQLTLKDPLNTLPALNLGTFQAGGDGYDRARFSQSVDRVNKSGRPVVVGPSYEYRYVWTLGLAMPEDDALLLERYLGVQKLRGYLVLEDEIQFLTPEPSPHSRSLLSGTTKTIADGITGLGRFAVWGSLPEDGAPAHAGMAGAVPWNGSTLVLHEIVGVTP